jgi:hypothetical protein
MTGSEDPAAPNTAGGTAEERSTAALLSDLVDETLLHVRQELVLFRTELLHNLTRAGHGVIALAIAAVFVAGGWCALLAAATLALSLAVPPWLAALLVAAVNFFAAAGLVVLGRRRLDLRSLAPRRALRSLGADAAWVRERTR